MKVLNLFVLTLAVFEPVKAAICQPAAASCSLLPAASAKSCSALIKAKNLVVSTCVAPKGTVTVTQTERPTTTSTKTVKATTVTTKLTVQNTVMSPTITLPGPKKTMTFTKIVLETRFSTTSTLLLSTRLITETTTTTTTEHWSTYTTTTTTWAQQTCNAQQAKRFRGIDRGYDAVELEERAGPQLPADCSCYLTSTQPDTKPKTKTSTTTKPITETFTKVIGGSAPTITSTVTIQKTTTIPTTIVPKSTLTTILTTISTSTVLKITTSISTQLETQTTKKTSTATSTIFDVWPFVIKENPCKAGQHGRIEIDVPHTPTKMFADTLDMSKSKDMYQDCCNYCYGGVACAYWAISTTSSDGTCVLYMPMEKKGCTSPQCSWGYPPLTLSDREDNVHYFIGPCGTNQV